MNGLVVFPTFFNLSLNFAIRTSDHEFLTAKFRPKLKKVGKTTRPFMYDLNSIPYDYTVGVTNE